MSAVERFTQLKLDQARIIPLLHKLELPAKRIEMIGYTIHITISGHGEQSQRTAQQWRGALSKLGKVTQKETHEDGHETDRDRGVQTYVKVTKVWCEFGGSQA